MGQISIDEYLRQETEPVVVKAPAPLNEMETVFVIPDDVWENRCAYCVHKNASENVRIPLWAVHKPQYEEIVPCRIMAIARTQDRPGECMSFSPRMTICGICETCRYNNIFHDGFCIKEDHSDQRRVFYGQDYGGDERNRDYYGRHRLSVCDDYEPDAFACVNKMIKIDKKIMFIFRKIQSGYKRVNPVLTLCAIP